MSEANRAAQPQAECVHHRDGGERAGAGPRGGSGDSKRPMEGSAARNTDCAKGSGGYGGRAHDGGKRALPRSRPQPGCGDCPAPESSGCGAAGQAEHARVCFWRKLSHQRLRPCEESLGRRVFARRIFRGIRGGGGRRTLFWGHWVRHGRLHPRASGLLRNRGAQADVRPRQHAGSDPAIVVARPYRADDADGTRCGLDAAGARGV